MTTPQLDDVKQRLRQMAETAREYKWGLEAFDRASDITNREVEQLTESLLEAVEAIEQRDRMLDEARAALAGLMEAHRVVFKSSLFPAFQAGKTNFNGAWVKADAALTKLEEMKR